MFAELRSYIENRKQELSEISTERKKKLKEIAGFITRKNKSVDNPAKITFICTHNSRRSHLCQIWAAVLASHFGVEEVQSYSGGTEATAFNPSAVAAVERAGFKVVNPGGENPRYKVFYDDGHEPLLCFSKTFDDSYNPQNNFAAIMTCSDADENCPHVPGASFRQSIPYIDPKVSDGSPKEKQTYDERCRQIAVEMMYLMSQVNSMD